MRSFARKAFICFTIFIAMVPAYAIAKNYKLTVTVTGLHSNQGKVYISLYNSQEGYPKDPDKAFRKNFVEIIGGKATLTFDDLPEGIYAAACFHDENNDGKLNTNFFGIPTEGVGASNDAKGFLGPPKFKDASFSLQWDAGITITMQY